ncbi:MAG: hypothetical protein NTW06_04300 [Candidatus Falkowbacteria bacterium]|nr:hypothetical protein [Candidatus Falkowbacteria bacterium]
MSELTSIYKGGRTAEIVRETIRVRFGDNEAEAYDATKNCFTFLGWQQRGFRVLPGQKGIRSYTVIAKEQDGEKKTYKKNIFLFARPQVEKVKS